MTYDGFWQDWKEAVDNFTAKQWTVAGLPGQITRYVHAEAATGSKYEVVGQEVEIDWRDYNPTLVITVLNPWQNAWTTPLGSHVYPDYALEHWKNPLREITHGGDAAALTICLNIITRDRMEEAIQFARNVIPSGVK